MSGTPWYATPAGLIGIAVVVAAALAGGILLLRGGDDTIAQTVATPLPVVSTSTTAVTSTTTTMPPEDTTTTTAQEDTTTTTVAEDTTTTVAEDTTTTAPEDTTTTVPGDFSTVVGAGFSQEFIDGYLDGCVEFDAAASHCMCTLNLAMTDFSEKGFAEILDDAQAEDILGALVATCSDWVGADGTVTGTSLVLDAACQEPITGTLVPYPGTWFTHGQDCRSYGRQSMDDLTRQEARAAAAFTFSIGDLVVGEVNVSGGAFEDVVAALSPVAELIEYDLAGRRGYIVVATEFGERGQAAYGYLLPLERDNPRSSAVLLATEGMDDDPAFFEAVAVIDAVIETVLFRAG